MAAALLSGTAAAETHTIEVTFTNIESTTGLIWASLCTEAEFENLGEEPCGFLGRVDAEEGAEMTFENIPSGTYAISAFHDSNANQRLDFNSRGIPDEPTGNSGNARGFFGPPAFSQMKFTLRDRNAGRPRTFKIKMMTNDIP
ncbi:MAG: DUF2141 domain-containing protein [Pseudomonadota bacterium]